MGDNRDRERISEIPFAIPRSESKSMAGQKRSNVEVGERSELGHKRLKMGDLELGSEGRMRKDTSGPVVGPAFLALHLNAKFDVNSNLESDNTEACVDGTNNLPPVSEVHTENSRVLGFDLNVEDVSCSANHDPIYTKKHHEQLKRGDASECGSTCGAQDQKDPMKVWKEMKQNGFMSASHGGVPIPKPRARKSKADGLKKKMEIARREQVDRFAKVAAPSGLLNELNPGIINHVRNSKQVYSIIEGLVRSERRENRQAGNKLENTQTKMERIESSDVKGLENINQSGNSHNFFREDDCLNTAPRSRQTINCPMGSEYIGRDNDPSRTYDKAKGPLLSNLENEENILALKLSSLGTMASQSISTLCDEDSADINSVSSLSVKAANVASQWLELLHQDIKGRLAALRRSKKRVRAVIQMELPHLLSREFSDNQENDPNFTKISIPASVSAIADMHNARWSALFDQMEKALCEEEKQLESWFNQVEEMHLHCDRGLLQCTGAPAIHQVRIPKDDCRLENAKDSEKALAVGAAAAAFYSTCNFIQSKENLPCF